MEPRESHITGVTACLLNWKRPHNMGRIVEHLLNQPFINEIIIHDNSKGVNIKTYGRYVSAQRASNSTIYVQDDDCIVRDIKSLYEAYNGLQSSKIVTGGTPGYLEILAKNKYKNRQMAMAGWGMFFEKDWIDFSLYTKMYGKDDCFYREADRIFTLLHGGYHTVLDGDIEHLEGYLGLEAMSSQPDHIKYKEKAIERCLRLVGR